jgi:hypothetical protein
MAKDVGIAAVIVLEYQPVVITMSSQGYLCIVATNWDPHLWLEIWKTLGR